ncbi:MAG TPA: VOC family protein [Candidatus Saccharimonadales bacterium]|nr:VOC family protein [Candidatus Saccharimonadales bacterium]
MLKKVLHTGVQVADLNKAIQLYEGLGFSVVKEFDKPEPKAKVAWVRNREMVIELWQFLDKKHAEVQYISSHLALSSDNLEKDVKALVSQGYKLVIPITQGVILRYAFVQDPAGANYEIAEDIK